MEFYGQPIFRLSALADPAVGYGLKLYQQPSRQEMLSVEQLERVLVAAHRQVPDKVSVISFDLAYEQLVDLRCQAMLTKFQRQSSVQLIPELIEGHSSPIRGLAVVKATGALFDAGMVVWIDNVGAGDRLPGLVEALTPYVAGYRFSLQGAAGFGRDDDLMDRFSFWQNKAKAAHKQFDVTDVESLDDVIYLQERQACELIQGPYFSHAVSMKM